MRLTLFRAFSSTSQKIKSLLTPYSNIKPSILELVDRRLYDLDGHPLQTIKDRLRTFYTDPTIRKSDISAMFPLAHDFVVHSDPVVSLQQNFDSLLIKPDHVSRWLTRQQIGHLLHHRGHPPPHPNLRPPERKHPQIERILCFC